MFLTNLIWLLSIIKFKLIPKRLREYIESKERINY